MVNGRGNNDHTFTIRECLENSYEFNINLDQLYNDFKKAFNSMNWIKVHDTMKEFGIPNKPVNLTKLTLGITYNWITLQNQLLEKFVTDTGVSQKDLLFTILFNTGLEKVLGIWITVQYTIERDNVWLMVMILCC